MATRSRALRGAREPQRRGLPARGARGARRRHERAATSSASSSTRARPTAAGRASTALGGARRCASRTTSASAPAATAAPRPPRGRLLAFVNFDGRVEPGWDAPLRALLDGDPGDLGGDRPAASRADGETIEAAGLEIAPNTATYGRLEGAPRAQAPAGPVDVTAASGALMMVRREEFLAPRRLLRAAVHVRRGGRLLPARRRAASCCTPARAIRHDMGHAAGPARSLPRLYHPARNRLVNAARHLPPLALAARGRRLGGVRPADARAGPPRRRRPRGRPRLARRTARDAARARARAPRRRSARPRGAAAREPPRGGGAAATAGARVSRTRRAVPSRARRAAPLPAAPAIRGARPAARHPGRVRRARLRARAAAGAPLPVVPTERLGELYPQAYNAYALPANPAGARGGDRPVPLALLARRCGGRRSASCGSAPPGRLLDVGSGRGDLGVTLAGAAGTSPGSSRRRTPATEARARGVPTRAGHADDAPTRRRAVRRGRLPALARARRRAARRPAAARELLAPGGLRARLAAELRLLARAPLRRRLVPSRPAAPPLALHRAADSPALLRRAGFEAGRDRHVDERGRAAR